MVFDKEVIWFRGKKEVTTDIFKKGILFSRNMKVLPIQMPEDYSLEDFVLRSQRYYIHRLGASAPIADKTIKDALAFPPTREIADACFNEALAVAKSKGYDFGEDILNRG